MKNFGELIRNFSPTWFAVVMGTGVFATSTHIIGVEYFPYFIPFSSFLVFLNFIMFFVILVPWSMRWLFYWKNAMEDMKNPLKANFYVTFGLAMLTLGMNFSTVVIIPLFSIIFWILGVISSIVIVIAIMFFAFIGTHAGIEHINPTWFLGSTALLLIPSSADYPITIPAVRDLLTFLFDFSFGTGFLLYMAILPVWIYRFILHEPLKPARIPLLWINMGPIGAILTSLATYYYYISHLEGISLFFSTLFFGFGVWWFIIATIITLYYIAKLRVPYRTAWWSFTFPLGQYLIGSAYFNQIFSLVSIDYFIIILYAALFLLWVFNMVIMLVKLGEGTLLVIQGIE